jgi:hypothetical protein
MAQAAANRFLYNQREQLEIGSRLSLIYDYGAYKLCPVDSDEMLDKVAIKALPCWEVIVDRDASGPDDCRFVGHNYYMTLVDARKLFGNKQFNPVPKKDYFDDYMGSASGTDSSYNSLPPEYLYVEVVELYDLLHDEVYYWSPNYSHGDKLLERSEIPIRTYNDNPLPNIVTLYYSRCPSKPMEGLSAVARVYDQIYEKNILRTYWANAVRREEQDCLMVYRHKFLQGFLFSVIVLLRSCSWETRSKVCRKQNHKILAPQCKGNHQVGQCRLHLNNHKHQHHHDKNYPLFQSNLV